jgi:predicted MFS family arabinose efflux permease
MTATPGGPLGIARGLRLQIVAATLTRLVLNTAHRMIYPFLPAISRGLGVPIESLTWMISVRNAMGTTAPLFGGLPDRYGRRQAMLLGLGIFCTGLALVSVFSTLLGFFLFLLLVVVGKFIFDPALQAYLGDRTPYARRGLVIAFTELSWSGAALIGLPLMGVVIAQSTWRAPFVPLLVLGLLGGTAVWAIIPRDRPDARSAPVRRGTWGLVLRSPVVVAALCLGLLISSANEILNVVYATWLEASFGLSVLQLGLSTTVIGLAELSGEGLVMSFADRLGLRRAIGLGFVASALAYLALPVLAQNLQLALAALFVVYVTFEFTIVASIPLMTELLPEARGRVLSASVAFHAGGRMLGALAGGFLLRYSFNWIGIASMSLNLLALVILVLFVRERK